MGPADAKWRPTTQAQGMDRIPRLEFSGGEHSVARRLRAFRWPCPMMATARKANVVLTLVGCVAATLFFFSPRLWLMRHYVPGSFQWDRAHTFLLQCESPLRRDIEPAMLWRLLPPAACHIAHLRGNTPLVVPWLGALVAISYVAILLRRKLDDARYVFGGTLLFATTSAILVPVGWLGMNDAWIWLGLLVVAFGRAAWAGPVACLLCPWIDERFIIGFPLAWLVRRLERNEPWSWKAAAEALWLLPYAATRLWLSQHDPAANDATHRFFTASLAQAVILVPLAPLGWWMGLRVGWLAIINACRDLLPTQRWTTGAVIFGTMILCLLAASDLSRSIAVLTPIMLLGCFRYAEQQPLRAPSTLLVAGFANLLIPAAHVTYIHIDSISVLPIEIMRLFRTS
jgi:hypothetical protein